ncbi:hypothetical protein [Bradyrhizobium sp. DOA1]|uniref:hypothetical protein n=1 Tax=Bradyrhizobium sp. DOA1 TaxID=1126616 RepID=UPI00077C1442|nr:hypothetical protein [Bradyrhizobium sp. DOA1]
MERQLAGVAVLAEHLVPVNGKAKSVVQIEARQPAGPRSRLVAIEPEKGGFVRMQTAVAGPERAIPYRTLEQPAMTRTGNSLAGPGPCAGEIGMSRAIRSIRIR